MNQPEERMENKSGHKKKAVAVIMITIAMVLVVPVLAWFYFQKSLQTVTKINEPLPLEIGAGDARDIAELELSNIDVTEGTYKDVVFCVYSSQILSYDIQLAHTTNIGFTYTIYPAKKTDDGGTSKVTYLGNDYYFDEEVPVEGSYLNKKDGSSKLASSDGTYHILTYKTGESSYSNVQASAEPLYWKNIENLTLPDAPSSIEGENIYIDYYVLRISWDSTVQNNKETDMIYLMAEAAGAAGTNTETE